MSAVLTFAGAAQGVTGSCYHLQVGDAAIVIDCGVFQGDQDAEAKNLAPFPFAAKGVNAVVLTHGHLDHVGRLPMMFRQGFAGPVIGHAASLDIAMLILEDSAKIANFSEREPLFDQDDLKLVRAALEPLQRYGETVTVGPFDITIYDAGHILGSSSVRVAWGSGADRRAIMFSGDLGMIDRPLIGDPNTKWDTGRDGIDYVVTESTYGNREHPSRSEVRKQFREVIARALSDGGKVLIPAFSIGRTQEIIFELNHLVHEGELAHIPVVLDGPLGISVTALYEKYVDCYDAEALKLINEGDPPLEFDTLSITHDAADSRDVAKQKGAAIIIAGSGMLQGGRIRNHLKEHLGDPRTDVLLVGFQASRTTGRSLQQGAKHVWIGGTHVPVRARITTIDGFSAHADRNVLLGWFDKLPRQGLRRAFVTHGEEESSKAYAQLLTDRFGVVASVPALGDAIELA